MHGVHHDWNQVTFCTYSTLYSLTGLIIGFICTYIDIIQVLSDHNLTFDLQSYPATIKHIPLIAAKFPKVSLKNNFV